MNYEGLLLEHRGPVSWLFLNRPEQLNAVGMDQMVTLRQIWLDLREREETRVIVFSGKGRAFCAGADMTAKPDIKAPPSPKPTFLDLATRMEEVLTSMPKPVIAALNGITCGGGLELAMMCDFIVAARSARIGDAHANFGMLPGGGSTVRLPRLVGPNFARYLMYTGDLFPAEQMHARGLVQALYEDATFEQDVQALAEKIAGKSPLGLRTMKTLIENALDIPVAQGLAAEKMAVRLHFYSHDATEGGAAFAEKRKPDFRGY